MRSAARGYLIRRMAMAPLRFRTLSALRADQRDKLWLLFWANHDL